MISFKSLCLRGRHDVSLKSRSIISPITVSSRASSLSAIHRGLRDSEKARAQGFKKTSLNTTRPGRSPPPARPTFKIRKGKKDITDTGPKPKSRRARFYDPDEPFGKKSLVYQLKSGDLREKLAGITERERPSAGPRDGRVTREQFFEDFKSNSGRSSAPDRRNDRATRDFAQSGRQSEGRQRFQLSSRPPRSSDFPRSFERRDSNRAESAVRSFRERPTSWENRREERDSPAPRERQAEQNDGQTTFRRSSPRDHGPVRILRTTAASQFLYGTSVVEAALKETTRQIYKLYIYCGENRRDDSRNIGLERKAERAGIPVTKVTDTEGLRMMDKMSEGRPHNGCIIEASPLPQLPVKSLGVPTEEPTNGFNVTLAHQSSEEAQINGTSDFIKCDLPASRKPFVLLLDRIQDPGNLGAILRSAAFLGVNAIGITKGHSATLTSVALKASAGASEVIKLFSVDSILDFLTRSREAGWAVYAAVAPTGRPRGGKHITLDRVESYDPLSANPTILVIGSEGEGLTSKTRRMADYEVSIPNRSGLTAVDSLNVSVATGILCSAFLNKQHTDSKFDNILETKEDEDEESESQLW
ncbi:hypothetical protein M426DRAFT_318328 [Hypoxylon sp. CI-4A]|nr:hypothetical protein M426DRAFT_318328 [Hypoxylon sp. CI-4A]